MRIRLFYSAYTSMNPGKNSYSLTRRNKSALLLFFFVAKLMANYTGTILPFGKTAPDANFVSEKIGLFVKMPTYGKQAFRKYQH